MTAPRPKVFATLLCLSLASPYLLCSQQQPAPPVFVPGAKAETVGPGGRTVAAPGIKIVVLEGRMSVNRLKEGLFVPPVVEVRDGNDRPIEGAIVTFTLPGASGAGASFPDGSTTKSFTTNARGQAMAEGYAPNNREGKFEVGVQAVYQNEKIALVIPQANSFQPQSETGGKKSLLRRKWLWIGGAAAAATVVAVVLTRDSGSSSPRVVVVTPGPPVIGGR